MPCSNDINIDVTEELCSEFSTTCDESTNSSDTVTPKRIKPNNKRDFSEVNQAFLDATAAFKEVIQDQPADEKFGKTVGLMISNIEDENTKKQTKAYILQYLANLTAEQYGN